MEDLAAKVRLASRSSVLEGFNDKALGGMNAHHVESFVADSGEAVRRCWRDYDDVAGADNDLFPVDDHGRLTGEHNASLGVGMLMQARAFAGREVTQKEGNTGARSARLRTQLWRLRL